MAYRTTTGLTGKELVKDQFLGERVFAVCTGPSLAKVIEDDWIKINSTGGFLWGTGLSIDLPQVPWFDFYSVTEQARLPVVAPKIKDLQIPKFYNRLTDSDLLRELYGYANDDPPPEWKETPAKHVGVATVSQFGFSPDLDYVCHMPEISAISGVLQPALWLGFTEIYLLGADFSGHYSDGSRRVVHAPRYISWNLNATQDEMDKNYPDTTFKIIANPAANPDMMPGGKFPHRVEYTTLEEVLG